MDELTLRKQVCAAEDNTVFMRSDFPEYHTESVGRVLSALTDEGVLLRLSPGVYVKPRMSRFGAVMPSVEHVVDAIATRDKAQVLPSGAAALNALGLSTQVPMAYEFLTTGSARKLKVGDCVVSLKRGVPRNFAYRTRLVALLVQALRCLGERNVGEQELSQIRMLVEKESNKEDLKQDVMMMPEWMKRLLKPMVMDDVKHNGTSV